MVLLFFSRSLTGRAVMELLVVVFLQGNLDPALNRHASLPAAQLAALCEVAASCLEPHPADRSAPAQDACPASQADQTKLYRELYLSDDSAVLQISEQRWSLHQSLLLQLASSTLPSCKSCTKFGGNAEQQCYVDYLGGMPKFYFCCRPTAARLVTYLQKLLNSTDSANTPVSRHGRTVSSPPAGPPSPTHHPSASDTPRDYHQQPTSGGESSSSSHQQPQHRQQTHQQHRHRPAQSMPIMGFTASPDWTADTAASTQAGTLPRGHDLRSSAGYGNELGIPGPSRRLTPLAQGLHAASLYSQPAAAASPAPASSPEDQATSGASSAALLPLAQEGPSSLPSMLPLQASPTRPDMRASRGESSLLDSTELAFGGGQALHRAGLMEAGRDLRDSAWGPSGSSQPPSAPVFPM